MTVLEFKNWVYNQHDVICNQKYNKSLPYSFHLDLVANNASKFKHLVEDYNRYIVLMGALGHDLIEDARVTYNDIVALPLRDSMGYNISVQVADVIYACTELRGKNRHERHGGDYIQELMENRLGLFVKLCDIGANVGFGVLTNSSMVKNYREEFPKMKEKLYREEFDELFVYIEKLLTLNK